MKIAIVSNNYISENIDSLRQALVKKYANLDIRLFKCDSNEDIYISLSAYAPNILVTENLAGFHMETLSGSIAYNLLHSRQLHFLFDEASFSNINARILERPLSLSMRFICITEHIKNSLLSINPDVPYFDVLTDSSPSVYEISEVLCSVIDSL